MVDWLTDHKIPLGAWLKRFVDFLNVYAQGFFDFITDWLGLIQRTAIVPFMLWVFIFALALQRPVERS